MKHPFIIAVSFGIALNLTPSLELQASPKEAKEPKEYLQVTEDTSAKIAPVDTHADLLPLRPAEKIHSESPILRENLELQDAPPSMAQDIEAMNPETNLALKPRKTRLSR